MPFVPSSVLVTSGKARNPPSSALASSDALVTSSFLFLGIPDVFRTHPVWDLGSWSSLFRSDFLAEMGWDGVTFLLNRMGSHGYFRAWNMGCCRVRLPKQVQKPDHGSKNSFHSIPGAPCGVLLGRSLGGLCEWIMGTSLPGHERPHPSDERNPQSHERAEPNWVEARTFVTLKWVELMTLSYFDLHLWSRMVWGVIYNLVSLWRTNMKSKHGTRSSKLGCLFYGFIHLCIYCIYTPTH